MSPWNSHLHEKMCSNFLVEDLDPHLSRVEVVGDRRVMVENHRGILEYNDTIMRIALADCELRILGSGMELQVLTLSELTITGMIASLEYTRTRETGRRDV